MPNLQVNTELCDGCGSCVEACPMDVLVLEAKKAKPVQPDNCMNCQLCEVECPNGAIKVSG
ncbi:MAG: ferredoxin family protein [Thermodesulfobacteriota bacterium]